MLECLIIGDSIAVGTHMELVDKCKLKSIGTSDSRLFNEVFPGSFYADTLIISLGSNDYKGIDTYDELFEMRQRVGAKNVFWILPIMNIPDHRVRIGGKRTQSVSIEKIQEIVKEIAEYYGDSILTTKFINPNGAEPSWQGYKDIAIKSGMMSSK